MPCCPLRGLRSRHGCKRVNRPSYVRGAIILVQSFPLGERVIGLEFRAGGPSATWAEFFPGPDCIAAAIKTIRNSRIDVRPRSGFAVGNVRRVKDICLADKEKYKVRVIHEPEANNTAHAALRGWPRDNDPLLELLAEDAWAETILNKDIPA